MTPTTSMVNKIEKYLQLRRSLGYQLRSEGQLLRKFAAFADAKGHQGPLTTELALLWARQPIAADRLYWARRLEIVRCFARYLAALEPGTEVPPRNLLGPAHRRTTPHIYSDTEISALVNASGRLRSSKGLRPRTYATLIGLLVCTGLRISEALNLAQVDADLKQGCLTIRETKFRKTRLIPLHSTTVSKLRSYAHDREQLIETRLCDRFFVSDQDQPLPYSTVRCVFRGLCDSLKIVGTIPRRPRLHDLRHTFACRCLNRCYEAGENLQRRVAALSVYLGHAKVSDTYWYLTATPELLIQAASRFEALAPLFHESEEIP